MPKKTTHGGGLTVSAFCAWALSLLFALFAAYAVYSAYILQKVGTAELIFTLLCAAVLAALAFGTGPLVRGAPEWLLCALPAALGAGIRLIFLWVVRVVPISDFERFYSSAAALLHGEVALPKYTAVFPHTMGYTALLSAAFRLFGVSMAAAQVLNLLLGAGISVLLYGIGRRLAGAPGGFWAALLWAFYPSQIFAAELDGTELPFVALMLGCVLLYLRLAESRRRPVPVELLGWACLGLLTAASSAVRPMWPLLVAAFSLHALFFPAAPRRSVPLRLASLAVMIAVCAGANSAVYAGIGRAVGQPIAQSGAGWNLYLGMNAEKGGAYNDADQEVFTRAIDSERNAPEIQAYFMGLAKRRIGDNLSGGQLIPLLRSKFELLWTTDDAMLGWVRSSQSEQAPSRVDLDFWNDGLSTLSNLYYLMILLTCAAGLLYGASRRRYEALLPAILVFGFVALCLVLEANRRYPFPAASLMCLPAAAALSAAAGGRRTGRRRGAEK